MTHLERKLIGIDLCIISNLKFDLFIFNNMTPRPGELLHCNKCFPSQFLLADFCHYICVTHQGCMVSNKENFLVFNVSNFPPSFFKDHQLILFVWNWEAMTPFDECSIISLIVSISSMITYTQCYLITDNYLNESVYYKFLA